MGMELDPKAPVMDVLALLLTLFGIPLLILHRMYAWLYKHATSTKANRDSLIPWLNSKMLGKYHALVKGVSGRLDHFYGEAHAAPAFGRSLSIALAYPVLLFFIAYSFWGGAHEFAGLTVFPEAKEGRLSVFWGTVLMILVMLVLILGGDWLDAKARKPFQRFIASAIWQDRVYRISMALLTVGVYSTYSSDWKLFLLIAAIGYWSGAFAVAFAFAVAVAVAVAFAVIFGNYTLSLVLLLFLTIFPLLNALFDFLSLQVSRYYLRATEKENNALFILGDIVVDGVIAVGFMLTLVIVLPGVTEWFNALYSQFDPNAVVDWRRYAQDAMSDPFGKGLMVTAMLLTTLLPTLLHIFLGLLTFTINMLFGKQLANFLQKAQDENGEEVSWVASVAAMWMQAYLLFVVALIVLLYLGISHIPHLAIGERLYAVAEYGHDKSWLVILILLVLTLISLRYPLWRWVKQLR